MTNDSLKAKPSTESDNMDAHKAWINKYGSNKHKDEFRKVFNVDPLDKMSGIDANARITKESVMAAIKDPVVWGLAAVGVAGVFMLLR